jgi:hypothetical protein
MGIPKLNGAQVDFTGGEVDGSAQRSNALAKAGVRQARNCRALNTGGLTNRPGRRVLFEAVGRVDKVVMAPGLLFYLIFDGGTLTVRDNTGVSVFTTGGLAWTAATAKDVRWVVYGNQIAITFPGQIPKVLTLNDGGGWSIADYAELVLGTQKRTIFYRLAPKGITMTVSGTTGLINIGFSAPVLTAPMVGTRIRFNGRQMTIASVTSSTVGTANVNESLSSNRQVLTIPTVFHVPSVGDVVGQNSSGATGVTVTFAAPNLTVELSTNRRFQAGDFAYLAGPGSPTIGSVTAVADAAPAASVIWDQEIMNASAGYPASCFFDQTRLGFCGFPAVPGGVAWSAVNAFTDLYPDAFASDGLATDAIFELVPGKSLVLNVMGGADANEFVFCDNAVYYVPITPANPLRPGSVNFILVTADGAGPVQPRLADEVVIYVAAGGNKVMAIVSTGFSSRLERAIELTAMHTHLLATPIAIAVPTVGGDFAERYLYVLNADGTLAVGKYSPDLKDLKEGSIGWSPWSGGNGKWVASANAEVIYTTEYGSPAESLAELSDNTRYLDGSQLYNTQPPGLPIPGGKGPLWYMAGRTVDLVDGGARMMGTYQVDANGFIVPQFQGGEDLTSATLTAGQAWTATFEPFSSIAQAGQDVGQRVKMRRITRFMVYVQDSTGFLFAQLNGGPQTPTSPPLGTIMLVERVPAWNIGDNPTLPPPRRASAFGWRPTGRSYDPRAAIIKDTPGPLTIMEAAMEITV